VGARVARRLAVATLGLSIYACGGDTTGPPFLKRQLAFSVEPSTSEGNVTIDPPPQIAILDQSDNIDRHASVAVTLALGPNAAGATLSGTTTVHAVGGIATFPDMHIDRPGSGYQLVATAQSHPPAASARFDVHVHFVQVTVAIFHSCGLTSRGFAYCWGLNDVGQIGDSTNEQRLRPALVKGGWTFTQLSAGGDHTCGITPSAAVYCWGSNFSGQLGDSSMDDRAVPVRVAGNLSFTQLSAGSFYTCGLTAAGAAWCWGSNVFGALGDGTRTLRLYPVPVGGGLQFSQVSAGGVHTCGIAFGNTAYCWGWNGGGQVGDSTTINRLTPTPVFGGLSFAEISANPGSDLEGHTCGVTTGSVAYCWGTNDHGQLGDGTTTPRLAPTPVIQ
jgi:hypothetical protein